MKQTKAAVKTNEDWKGYVNYNPVADEREKIVDYMGRKNWAHADEITSLVQSGYSVTFAHDEKSDAIRLSVTGKKKPCPNIGWSLSIRASTVERCVGIAGYYVYSLCGGGDWLVEKTNAEVW
jgi:hypothetical protein